MSLGDRGELLVARHVQAQGWQIMETRWRGPGGELDVVAMRQEVRYGQLIEAWRVIEVKTRARYHAARPAKLAVSASKRERIVSTTLLYLSGLEPSALERAVRFDVACVYGGGQAQQRWRIEVIEGAFDGAGRL